MADNMAVTGESVMRELTDIGQMAYGVKYGHGAKGGNGNVGMMGDEVIKFNTHWQERRGPVTDAMRQSCDGLRLRLYDLARQVYKDEGRLTAVRKELGLDAEGKPLANRKLLERTVVAKMVTTLSEEIPTAFREDCPADTDVWKAVKAKGPATQENTNYADLRKKADMDDFRHAVKYSFDKLLPKPSARHKPFARTENATPVEAFASVRRALDTLAGEVYDGTKSLKQALGTLVKEVRDVKCTAGLSDPEAIALLKNLSCELNQVAVRGRQARGEKPSLEKPALMLVEQRTVEAAIDRITDAVMTKFVGKREGGNFEVYVGQLLAGMVEDRDVVKERVEREIFSSDVILQGLTKPTDYGRMAEVNDFIRNDLREHLGKQKDIAKGTVSQAVMVDFAREVNSPTVASLIKIDGVGMKDVFEDEKDVPTEQEIRDIGRGHASSSVGGVRVAKKIIDCVPSETPARKEIVNLITDLVTPVSGPVGGIGQKCDLGLGTGYELSQTGKIMGLTDFRSAPPSVDIRHLDGKIVVSTTFDAGIAVAIKNLLGGEAWSSVLVPRSRITYEVEIPLNQPAPATPDQLQFTVTTRSRDVHLY